MGDPFKKPGSRIEALSDGVFAIILTILVLDLRLPGFHSSNQELWAALFSIAPKMLSFAFSFFVVAVYWVNHHYFFHSIGKTDRTFTWLNINLLFWLCFIPFPTSVIGEYPTAVASNVFYAVSMLMCAISYWCLTAYACRAKLFENPDSELDISKRAFYSRVGIALYALAVIAGFFSWVLSMIIFIGVPLFYFLPMRFIRKT